MHESCQRKETWIIMSSMIRKDREITDINEILKIIDKCKVMRLGFCEDNEAYIVPMNFGCTYENDKLTFYFHGALKGRKYEIMEKNSRVGFEMDCDVVPYEGKLPCQYGTEFSSVIGRGKAELINDPAEKMEAVKILMKTQTGKDFEFTEKLVSVIQVFKVTASEFTCKRRLHTMGG